MFTFETSVEITTTPRAFGVALRGLAENVKETSADSYELVLGSMMGGVIRGEAGLRTDDHDRQALCVRIMSDAPFAGDEMPEEFLKGLTQAFEAACSQFLEMLRDAAQTVAAAGALPLAAQAETFVPTPAGAVESRLRQILRVDHAAGPIVVSRYSPEGWVRHEFQVHDSPASGTLLSVTTELDIPLDSPAVDRADEILARLRSSAPQNLAELVHRLRMPQRAIGPGGIQSQL